MGVGTPESFVTLMQVAFEELDHPRRQWYLQRWTVARPLVAAGEESVAVAHSGVDTTAASRVHIEALGTKDE